MFQGMLIVLTGLDISLNLLSDVNTKYDFALNNKNCKEV
jgi:hypothetical protein